MDFDLTPEQRQLAESVRRFLEKEYAFAARRKIVASDTGFSAEAWKAFADLGLLALPIPEEHGGFAGTAMDLMPVMELLGEALVVEPYAATLMGARIVDRGGPDDLRSEILPAVAEGAMKLAVAHTEPGARYDLAQVAMTATPDGEGWVLEGAKRVVPHGPQADRWLVTARTAGTATERTGISLFVVDPRTGGIDMDAHRTIDGRRSADATFRGARVPAEALVGRVGEGLEIVEDGVDYAGALLCAEAVGVMKCANDATLEYLKTRKQFGMPIGAFQALQHRMVDLAIELEQARSMASLACASVSGAPASHRQRMIAAARIRIAAACRRISQESVQLHGGMGMTEELKVSHAFRRLTAIAREWGDEDHYLARFAEAGSAA